MFIVNCKKKTASVEDNGVTGRYFAEIRKIEQLNDEQQKELLKIVKFGSEEESNAAREKLIGCNQRFVASVAKHLTNGDNFNDLVSEGNLGLNKAIDKFDLSFKQHFITYATFWINKCMVDYMTNVERMIVPKNATRVNTYVASAANDFFLENGRNPSVDELKNRLNEMGVPISNTDDIIGITMVSLNEIDPDGDIDDDTNYTSYTDYIDFQKTTSSNNIEEEIDLEDIRNLVEMMVSCLDSRQQDIVRRYYGIGRCEEPTEVIARSFGVPTTVISKEIYSAMNKIRKTFKITKKRKNGKN